MPKRAAASVILAVAAAAALASAPGRSIAQNAPTESPPAAPAQAPAPDQAEIVLHMKDGTRIAGYLISADAKQLVVRVAGIDTRIAIDLVDRYDVLPPVLERYQELRRTIGEEPDDLVRLAQWLQGHEQYGLAITEINRALAKDAGHAEALRLKPILEQQLLLKVRAGKREPSTPGSPEPKSADPVRMRPGEFPLLSTEDINLIKVYEVDLSADPPPKIIIARDTIAKVLEANAGHPLVPLTREGREAIVRKPGVEVLDLFFKLQARDAYAEVKVLDQPPAIKLFRDQVNKTWLMSCATTQCHGGLEAGRLVLESRSPGSDASVYTNLLILSRFQTTIGPGRAAAPGTPRGTNPASGPPATPATAAGEPLARPLINWDNPERSPLLQLGLPREDSLFPHPVVPRPASGTSPGGGDLWKPQFRSVNDRAFERTVDWLRSMYRPRPEYPVKYTPLRPFVPSPPASTDGAPGSPGTAPPEPVRR